MKVGLLADVRGMVAPLRIALTLLRDEKCEAIACLGSTVEGGPGDAEVLAALDDAGATILPSPHDVEEVGARPREASLAGLALAHETPAVDAREPFWFHGMDVPSVAAAAATVGDRTTPRACGDLYAPLVYLFPETGSPRRRLVLRSERLAVSDGTFLACPGSVAMAAERGGGSVMTWDDATRELSVVSFGFDGPRGEGTPVILVVCEDFPEAAVEAARSAGVELAVLGTADSLEREVEEREPDLLLLDYHLSGERSGLDALLALTAGRPQLPLPVYTIAGNPADVQGMKAVGARGGIPRAFLAEKLADVLPELVASRS